MFKWLCTLVLLCRLSGVQAGQEIIIGADIWCPYNCEPSNTQKPGFIVEVAQAIFSQHGITVRYQVIPWSRAKILVSQNAIQGLIAATPANTRDMPQPLIFPQQEQARMKNSFFTLSNNTWQYKGVKSLKAVQLGVIQGYDYGPTIQPYIRRDSQLEVISGNDALARLINMMQWKRIDTILEDEAVFKYTLNQTPLFEYRIAGSDDTPAHLNNLYIAFSAHSKSLGFDEILSNGMTTLRQNGQLKVILARYGLTDWK